jgi:hypothetical protein
VASTYSRSVLGALGTLREGVDRRKGVWTVPAQRATFSRDFQQRADDVWTHSGDNCHVQALSSAGVEGQNVVT